MRKISLLSVLITCYAICSSNAQQKHIAANGGVSLTAVRNDIFGGDKPAFCWNAGLQFRRSAKKSAAEYGLSLDLQPLSTTSIVEYIDINGQPIGTGKARINYASPSLSASFFAGFYKRSKKMGAAAGISAGYCVTFSNNTFNPQFGTVNIGGTFNGLITGIYGRLEYGLSKRLDLDLGLAPRFFLLSGNREFKRIYGVAVPFSLGLSYRL